SVSTVSLEPSLCAAVPTSGQPSPEATPRLKARSYSSPLPYNPSTAALRDDTDAEVKFEPDYFGSRLPRELQLQVLASLVALHAAEHARAIDDGTWNTAVASSREGRWVGRDRGIRELVKLSRVSRAWRVLVLDGQLFTELDLKAFTNVPPSFLVQLAQAGGSFVRTLDVAGYVRCTADTFFAVTDGLCGTSAFRFTRLTSVNLAGCMLLSARALHHLLMHSPSLQDICLRGLDAVTNTTCDIFGAYCTQLRKVDLGRCANMDASGIRAWCNAVLLRCGERLCLTELRVCGLKHVDDAMMAALGRAAPNLEILDLSYAHQMHNSAIDAFVASAPDVGEVDVDTVWVNAQDIGRAPAEGKLRRRLTRLRHLSLSSCILLTDIACASLAHTVPRLEFLELANIGEEMGDDGLLKLFATTPLIRRVDLEDAVDISDAVLAALTPVQDPTQPEAFRRQAGHALENLVISHAMEVSNDAISRLVNSCPRLRVLEADHTSLRSSTMKRFIEKTREGHMCNAKIVGIDCRSISENAVKNVVDVTRPRLGWRAHDARRLKYVDGRDPTFSQLQQPVQDECDEMRVVLKTYYSWQTVDAVKAAYANIHKTPMPDSTGAYTAARESAGLMRWWSPGGRR
ncbi:RNI-like protein, partial [Fistulina hepatica ATCC 64428]